MHTVLNMRMSSTFAKMMLDAFGAKTGCRAVKNTCRTENVNFD